MKIGIDTRDLALAKTGTRTVLIELLKAFESKGINIIRLSPCGVVVPTTKIQKILEHLKYFWWKEVSLPGMVRRGKCDVLLCNDYVVPFFTKGFEAYPFFHDTLFWDLKSHYSPLWRHYFSLLAIPAARRSAGIIANSQFTKSKLIQILKFKAETIHVIQLGAKSLKATSGCQFLSKWNLRGEKYLLHVGVMEKRKNLVRLIQAFKLLDAPNLKLILAGQRGPKHDLDDYENIVSEINITGLQKQVILTDYLKDEELFQAYQHTSLLVFPSNYEGFGIPVIEAFRQHVPVITSNIAAFREVVGEGGVFFDGTSPHDIAAKIKQVLSNADLRKKLLQNGKDRLNIFSWNSSVDRLMQVFQS